MDSDHGPRCFVSKVRCKMNNNKILELVNLMISLFYLLRELAVRSHFSTIFISLKRRTLYKDIGKHSKFKAKIFVYFFTR